MFAAADDDEVIAVASKRHRDWALGTSPITDSGELRMAYIVYVCIIFCSDAPDLGSVRAISSFLL